MVLALVQPLELFELARPRRQVSMLFLLGLWLQPPPASPTAAPPATAVVARSGAIAVRCPAAAPATATSGRGPGLWRGAAAGRGIGVTHRSVPAGPVPQPSAPDRAGSRPGPAARRLDRGLGPAGCGWLPAGPPVRRCASRSPVPAVPAPAPPPADPIPRWLRSGAAAGSADPAGSRHPAIPPGSAGPPHESPPVGSRWPPAQQSS